MPSTPGTASDPEEAPATLLADVLILDDIATAAQQINREAARLGEALAPERPWATDEPYPREAFVVMWNASRDTWWGRLANDVDSVTEALWEEWAANLSDSRLLGGRGG